MIYSPYNIALCHLKKISAIPKANIDVPNEECKRNPRYRPFPKYTEISTLYREGVHF